MKPKLKAFVTQRTNPEPVANILYLEGDAIFNNLTTLKPIDKLLSKSKTFNKELHEINLSGVTNMDEAGLGALLYLSTTYPPTGSATRWAGIPRAIEHLLIASGMLAPIATLPPDNDLHRTGSDLYDGLIGSSEPTISDAEVVPV